MSLLMMKSIKKPLKLKNIKLKERKIMKYKIGDKVRIIRKEVKEDALEEDIINSAWNQDIDKYL